MELACNTFGNVGFKQSFKYNVGSFDETAESGMREEYANIRKVTISPTPEIGSSDLDAFWTVVVTFGGISLEDTFHSIPRWPLCHRLRNKIILKIQ